MRYIIPLLAVFIFTACSRGKGVITVPYDLPPAAPIPPETYCFESRGLADSNLANMVISIAGDSVFGKLDYVKPGNRAAGTFIGVIYGTTLSVNYMYKDNNGLQVVEQEWKLAGDSIYKPMKKPLASSPVDSAQLVNPNNLPGTLYKVSCK